VKTGLSDRFGFPRPWFSRIDRGSLRADAVAGFTNAVIVLPQGVAFAVIAGMPPEYGLFTAMIPAVIAAVWGSSMVMVSGPTTAISAVLFTALASQAVPGTSDYVALALALTVMVGAFQLGAGLLRLGAMISFISHSVMIGFTAAAALLIGASQLPDALGIEVERGGGAAERLAKLFEHADEASLLAAAISATTLGTVILVQKLSRKLPGYLIALAAGAVVARLLDAESAGIAMFATLPTVIPAFELPDVTVAQVSDLLPGAATIAFVGLLEAVSIGRTFAMRRNERFDSNQEFVGQGLSNLVGGFFQCYAASGSFTRSGLNAESGARTPLSAVLAAAFLFVLLLVLAPLVRFVPEPAMAGIILYVAWRLINFAEIRHILRAGRDETLILVLTFGSAVLTELDVGILVGVITSLAVFLTRSARPHVAALAPAMTGDKRHMRGVLHYGLEQCPEISLLRIEGPLFFASCEYVESEFRRFDALFPGQHTKVLALKGLGGIDLAGADLLISEIRRARAAGGDYHIIVAHIGLVRALRRFGVIGVLGQDHLHPTKTMAIAAAVGGVPDRRCATCRARVYQECAGKPAPADVERSRSPKMLNDIYSGF